MTNGTKKANKVKQGKRTQYGRQGAVSTANRSKTRTSDPNRRRPDSFASPRKNFERYMALARDAASSGDAIESENYYQHAEHYFRLVAMA